MGWFSSGSDHHETPCRKGGFGWPQNTKNPMGWGKDEPRPVKGKQLKMHGSRGEKRLMSGKGGLIKTNAKRVKVTGEKPGKRGPR